MLEPRLYRLGLLLALAAAVVLMFSVVSRPPTLRSEVAPDAFDGARATALDRQMLEVARERQPGSAGDAASAAFVAQRFRTVQGGQVAVQRFSGSFDDHDVQMRNVSLVLPGLTDRRIVVIAARDCAAGPCAVSSGAATATLLELADAFDGARHTKTLVLVSTDGSTAGAEGAKMVAAALQGTPTEAAVVISQPGSDLGRHPFVVPWSAGPQSASIQLLESAETAVSSELGGDPLDLGTFGSLFRLAIPSGLQEQAVLIEHGIDSIGISSAGDRPLPSSEDGPGSLDSATLGSFGRATLSLLFALDSLPAPLQHGPDAYLPLAGKLIPGWALALLAIALLVPVGLVSVDGIARASRANEPVGTTLLWTLGRSLPFLAALAFAALMSLVDLIPNPAFPFDPQRHSLGIGAGLALVAMAAVFVLAVIATRSLAAPRRADEAVTPAIGLAIFVSIAAVWLADPYLALLLVPTAHLWLGAALPEVRGQVIPVVIALLIGMIVPLVAIAFLGSVLGVGWGVPWQLVLMFTGGHFGIPESLGLCVLGGCMLAILELTFGHREPARDRPAAPRLGRHAGPGALGGPPSTAVPGHKS